MIVLDTNVISELIRPRPDPRVLRWIDAQDRDTLFVTTVTQAELLYGIAILPEGKRRRELLDELSQTMDRRLADRVLPFDSDAAALYAERRAAARRAGQQTGIPDALIAAIAASRGFAVATRDTAPFVAMGVPVLDPFTA